MQQKVTISYQESLGATGLFYYTADTSFRQEVSACHGTFFTLPPRNSRLSRVSSGIAHRLSSTRAPRIIPAAPIWQRFSRSRNRKKLATLMTKITPTL